MPLIFLTEKTGMNTDIYLEDVKEAEHIKKMINKRITK